MELEAGLASLPSRRQVMTSVAFGRNDPFAVPPAALPAATLPPSRSVTSGSAARSSTAAAARAASGKAGATAAERNGSSPVPARPTPLKPPEGFQLTGVIRSGGKAEALVSYRSSSGSLRPGDRGGRTTALLPAGWALGAIQFEGASPADPPSITLLKAGQRVKVSL